MKHLAAAVLLLIAAIPAKAELLDRGKTTIDTVSGLEWLDLIETKQYTANEINTKNNYSNQNEWRLATLPEVQQLFAQFGFKPEDAIYPPSDPWASSGFSKAAGFIGVEYFDEYTAYISGTVDAPLIIERTNQLLYPAAGVGLFQKWEPNGSWSPAIGVHLTEGGSYSNIETPGITHFLVRSNLSAIPEPATYTLVLIGGSLLIIRKKLGAFCPPLVEIRT
jgi:hypothetical protein